MKSVESNMWLVKLITFVENHPYFVLGVILIIGGIIRFFWKEHHRLSYQEKRDLERFLTGFEDLDKDK